MQIIKLIILSIDSKVHADSMTTVRDPDAEKCFYVVMWLWCVRNEDFEAATVWLTKARDFAITTGDDSLANIYTTLYLLEGMILYIVCRADQRNVRAVAQAYKEVEALIKNLEKTAKTVKMIVPRLIFLFYLIRLYLFKVFCVQIVAFESLL